LKRKTLIREQVGKCRRHTSLVSKKAYLLSKETTFTDEKEEMKVRSTNVESPRKNKFATMAHQLVSLSMKLSAQKREKRTKQA
jgi:hypothetical protein